MPARKVGKGLGKLEVAGGGWLEARLGGANAEELADRVYTERKAGFQTLSFLLQVLYTLWIHPDTL